MTACLVALGANLGDPRRQLEQAVDRLDQLSDTHVERISRWITTPAVGGPVDQPAFLNGAVVLDTALSPTALWQVLREIETDLGRRRDVPWGPRSLDLDLLLFDDQVNQGQELIVPHPWMMARGFVLGPACEIAPDWRHPLLGWKLRKIADRIRRWHLPVVLIPGDASLGEATVQFAERIQRTRTAAFPSIRFMSQELPDDRGSAGADSVETVLVASDVSDLYDPRFATSPLVDKIRLAIVLESWASPEQAGWDGCSSNARALLNEHVCPLVRIPLASDQAVAEQLDAILMGLRTGWD